MWTIHLLENTVKLTKKAGKALASHLERVSEEVFSDAVFNEERGELVFCEDQFEHMDYVGEIQHILKKYKAKGRILFADLEGHASPQFWGYEFDGKGGMKKLTGKLTWKGK